MVARGADNPLDKINIRILRRFKNNDVSPMRILKLIHKFIRQNILAVVEVGFHAGSFDLVRLVEEQVHDHKYRQGHHNRLKHVKKEMKNGAKKA